MSEFTPEAPAPVEPDPSQQPASGQATADAAVPSPTPDDAGAPSTDAAEATSTVPAPDETDQPISDAPEVWVEAPEAAEPPVQSLSDLPPDADANPAFHGEEQVERPEPEAQTAYSDKPAPFTVV